jgi:hypothetical protein
MSNYNIFPLDKKHCHLRHTAFDYTTAIPVGKHDLKNKSTFSFRILSFAGKGMELENNLFFSSIYDHICFFLKNLF